MNSRADQERFVAHIDILGMSALVSKDIDEAWAALSALTSVRDKCTHQLIEFVGGNGPVPFSDTIRSITFSDTIIFYTKESSDDELRCMIVLLCEVLHKALCQCVPVRIGLSCGKFYVNEEKSMYMGPALIEAYKLGESAQWIGAVLAESVAPQALALGMRCGDRDLIVQWAVPHRGKIRFEYVANWPAAVADDFKTDLPISTAKFYEAFLKSFGPFRDIDVGAQAKYSNTVAFINAQLCELE